MPIRIAAITGLAALLALVAWGAAGVTEVDLKGWYTEAAAAECATTSCVCLAAQFPNSTQPPPVSGWAATTAQGGNVTIATALEVPPNRYFRDRRSTEPQDGRLHLQLNVMLYRNQLGGLTTPVMIRPEVVKNTGKLVRIYVEPNQ
jgi:hypothetical protein